MQRWPEAVIHSWGSYFGHVPKASFRWASLLPPLLSATLRLCQAGSGLSPMIVSHCWTSPSISRAKPGTQQIENLQHLSVRCFCQTPKYQPSSYFRFRVHSKISSQNRRSDSGQIWLLRLSDATGIVDYFEDFTIEQ